MRPLVVVFLFSEHGLKKSDKMADKSAAGLKLLLEYQQLPVEEQAKVFLRTFVMDFRGNFDEILTLAERFATYRTRKPTDEGAVIIKNLEEADLYRFLEVC